MLAIGLAIEITWIVLVPCEVLGVQGGLGYFIVDTRDRPTYPELIAAVLAIGVVGFVFDALARVVILRVAGKI